MLYFLQIWIFLLSDLNYHDSFVKGQLAMQELEKSRHLSIIDSPRWMCRVTHTDIIMEATEKAPCHIRLLTVNTQVFTLQNCSASKACGEGVVK